MTTFMKVSKSIDELYPILLYFKTEYLHQTCFNDFSNVKWCMKQTSVQGLPSKAEASVTYLDKHSTLDPVIVSVASSIPSGGGNLC